MNAGPISLERLVPARYSVPLGRKKEKGEKKGDSHQIWRIWAIWGEKR
jgi:hypothetical protein